MKAPDASKTASSCVRWLMVSALAFQATAYADMRCKSGLASEGDLTREVERKCGAPQDRKVIPAAPASIHNGQRRQGANIEYWTYGPRNGAYYELKFIDARLVSIKSFR